MKLKTHKGVSKRIKVTKSGKVKYSAGGRGHLLSSKTSKRKRRLRKSKVLQPKQQTLNVKQLLPYS